MVDIQVDLEDGTKAGVSGTPGFFVNGVPFSGAQSAEAFTRVVDEELARLRSSLANTNSLPVHP
jgi:protein-disulfide isomerase